jgi:hypothetical protein
MRLMFLKVITHITFQILNENINGGSYEDVERWREKEGTEGEEKERERKERRRE